MTGGASLQCRIHAAAAGFAVAVPLTPEGCDTPQPSIPDVRRRRCELLSRTQRNDPPSGGNDADRNDVRVTLVRAAPTSPPSTWTGSTKTLAAASLPADSFHPFLVNSPI